MADREHQLVTMSFGEHLEELRRRLFRALLVMAVGTLLALTVQKPLLKALTTPHRRAMARIQVAGEARACLRELARARHRFFEDVSLEQGRRLLDALEASEAIIAAIETARREQSLDATLTAFELAVVRPQDRTHADLAQRLFTLVEKLPAHIEHAIEVGPSNVHDSLTEASAELQLIADRRVLWRAAAPAGTELDAVTLEQLVDELSQARGHLTRVIDAADPAKLAGIMDPELRLAALSYTEPFFSHMRVCLIAGLAVGLPWLTFEIWFFIAGGLYHMERRAVFPFIPLSLGMLVLGALFAYWVLVPVGLGYLGSYGDPELIQPSFTLARYLSLVMAMLVGMGLVFQVPLVMVFVTRAGLVDVQLFRRYRRICLLGALAVGAMLTPPDVVTQILMAVPLAILYEAGIWASDFFQRRRGRAERKAAPKRRPDDDEAAQD